MLAGAGTVVMQGVLLAGWRVAAAPVEANLAGWGCCPDSADQRGRAAARRCNLLV